MTSLARYTLRAAAVYDADPVAVLHNSQHRAQPGVHGADPHFCTVALRGAQPRAARIHRGVGQRRTSPRPAAPRDGTVAYQPTPGGMLVGAFPMPHSSTPPCVWPRVTPCCSTPTDSPRPAPRTTDGRFEEEALLAFTAAIAPTTAPAAVAALTTLLTELGPGLEDDVAVLAISVPSRRPT